MEREVWRPRDPRFLARRARPDGGPPQAARGDRGVRRRLTGAVEEQRILVSLLKAQEAPYRCTCCRAPGTSI